MNGLDSAKLLAELDKLAARRRAIEKQLQQLRAKRTEVPPVEKEQVVPAAPSTGVGVKRPASQVAAADPKRQRAGPSKDASKRFQSVWRSCSQILKQLKKHRVAVWFLEPVNPSIVPDYHDIVKNPMDLGTVMKRLEAGQYAHPQDFRNDMRLIFSNCRLYNKPNTEVGKAGEMLSNDFESKWLRIQQQLDEELDGQETHSALTAPMKHTVDAGRQLDGEVRERLQASRPSKPAADSQELTFEEKRKLSVKLGDLPPEKLDRVLEIIGADGNHNTDSDAEIELDIDMLSQLTLRRLWDYVQSLEAKSKPGKGGKPGQPSDSGADRYHERDDTHHTTSNRGPDGRADPHSRSHAEGQASQPSTSSRSGGSSSSASESRGASQEKVASTWGDGNNYGRAQPSLQGDGNGAATVDVSTTEKVKHSILKPQSNKKDLSLKNASQWHHAVATTKVQANGRAPPAGRDELWDQFVTKDEKIMAKKKEELEQQERQRLEKHQKEEQERQARLREAAAEEAKRRDLALQKEQELERLRGMAGTAKLTNQTDYELVDMPKNDMDMNKVLGLKPIETEEDDEY